MAITIISQPAAIFPAYNPAPLVLKALDGEEDITMYFKIDGATVSTHKREFFVASAEADSLAEFDLGRIARDFFSNVLIEINATENAAALHSKAYSDHQLYVSFTTEIAGLTNQSFTAVNAALAPGIAEADYSAWQDSFLTEFPSFKYYAGYSNKSILSILATATALYRVATFQDADIGGFVNSVFEEENGAFVCSLGIPSMSNPTGIVYMRGGVLVDTLPVEYPCTPSAPFYVRWVNRIGGREHWMFSRKQTDKTDTDDSVTYDPRITTNADLGKDPRQISLTSPHTVVVGAEGIPNAEFDVLRRITVSPVIEYYDESNLKWRVITIKSGATSKDTSSPVQSIELEFTLPAQALQF